MKKGLLFIAVFFISLSTCFSVDHPKVEVFPNPIRKDRELHVHTGTNIKSVSIYTISGDLISSYKVNSDEFHIESVEFKSGMYIITVETDTGDFKEKLVVR